jgi:hypothetical protein
MQFALYEDWLGITPVSGAPVLTKFDTPMNDGYFVVGLDFGASAFQGETRYMEIAVGCQPTSTTQFLFPLIDISPTPYALSLRPGAVVRGEVAPGSVLYAQNTYTGGFFAAYGIHGNSPHTGVYGEGDTGLYGNGTTYGVDGYGITGVRGQGSSTGVLGEGSSVGVQGTTSSSTGKGVFGYASSMSGVNYGVMGKSESNTTGAAGVYGYAGWQEGEVYGVFGHGTSVDPMSAGVYGYAQYGGSGVYGYGVSGSTGVRGYSASGYAIYSEGDTHIAGDLTWYTRTSYLSVPAASFIATESSYVYTYTHTGQSLASGHAVMYAFVAPLNLPHGATVTKLTLHYYNSSVGEVAHDLWLYEANFALATCEMAYIEGDAYNPGYPCTRHDTSITPGCSVVDNSQYYYYLYLHHAGPLSSIQGAVIEYTYTEPY